MLTKEQQQAVQHVYGPMMVVAGPGSGKTRVLTERIRQLLQYTAPQRILVITFARKAAEEMQHRFAELVKDQEIAEKVCFGTFHSVFYRWLRKWGVAAAETRVLDEEQKIDLWRELGWDMEDVPAFLLCNRDAARRYQEEKQKRKLIDFEDMIGMMDKEIRHHKIWEQYDFFLIDEFQDINPMQYKIVKEMVGAERPNLFIVGDEDQAIYAFRGSDPEIFLHFPQDFPGCRRVDLTQNFRCQAKIVESSQELIRHNQYRFDKTIIAKKGKGAPVRLYTAFDDRQEAVRIRKQIQRQHRKGCSYEEMAILCRTRAQMQRIMAALTEGGVPYVSREPLRCSSKPDELLIEEDLKLIWRLCRERNNVEAYRAVMRVLPLLQAAGHWHRVEAGQDILEGVMQQRLTPMQRREFKELSMRLNRGAAMEQKQAFWYWLWQTDYLTYAFRKAKQRGVSKLMVGKQIWAMMHRKKTGVLVSTMHGAKGLEFDWVWVAGLTEGECPRAEAIKEEKLEEERRLLYVAMTRARRGLILSCYDGIGYEKSRFLQEIKSLQTVC